MKKQRLHKWKRRKALRVRKRRARNERLNRRRTGTPWVSIPPISSMPVREWQRRVGTLKKQA